jgi:glycerol kinase
MQTKSIDPLILAIDQGTHATRALLFLPQGELVKQFHQDIHLKRIDNQRVEQDPLDILGSCGYVIREALGYAAEHGFTIQSAGLCTQRSTVVAFDRKTGTPLSTALSWQDTRGKALTDSLSAMALHIEKTTGLPLSPHFGASKMRWLLEQQKLRPGKEAGWLCIAPLAAYLVFQLTDAERVLVDLANGARTQLMDWRTGDWAPELLTLFGIPVEVLPTCRPMRSDFGRLRIGKIPLMAVNGDQGAALLARGPLTPGEACINIGTGAFVAAVSQWPISGLLFSQIDAGEGRDWFACEGSVNGAGAALAWLAEIIKEPNLTFHLDTWLEQCADPPIFLNYIGGLGSPWWRSDVESRFLDVSMDQALADPIGAACGVAESILFLLKSNLDHMQNTGLKITHLRVSGGLSQIHNLMRRMASLCQIPIHLDTIQESSSMGIAWQASGALQPWPSGSDKIFRPHSDINLQKRYGRFIEALGSK